MARKRKELERREGWYHVKESYGKGRHRREFNITVDLRYSGMEFDRLREELDQIEKDHGEQFERFKIELEMEADPYEDREWPRVYVYGWREETDEEYQTRLDEIERQNALREAREREQYEALKKKFE